MCQSVWRAACGSRLSSTGGDCHCLVWGATLPGKVRVHMEASTFVSASDMECDPI